jgi:hypothetical protein
MNKKNSFMVFGFMLLAATGCEAGDKDHSRERLKIDSLEASSSNSASPKASSLHTQGTLVVKDMPPQLVGGDVTFKLFFDRTRIYVSKGSLSDEIQLTIPQNFVEEMQLMAPMHYTVTHDKTNSVEAYGACKMPVGERLKRGMVFEVLIDGRKLTKKSLEGFDVLIPECTVSVRKAK